MIKFFKDDLDEKSKKPDVLNKENTQENFNALDVLNKTMEKLRARLFTLAESSLPEGQANSFKKVIKDYTSEAWNILTKLLSEKSKEDKNEGAK